MAGTFGYELDLVQLSQEEKEEIREQVQTYHRYGELIQKGWYYRLSNPFEEEVGAWMFVSKDQSEALVNLVLQDMTANRAPGYVKLKGLKPGAFYEDEASKTRYPADALMDMGILVPQKMREYDACQIFLKIVEQND